MAEQNLVTTADWTVLEKMNITEDSNQGPIIKTNKNKECCQHCIADKKSCHLFTADIVKNLHAELRKKYKQCQETLDVVWKEHCQDQAKLSEYSSAMYHLATDHWTTKDKTRIDWCRSTCLDYFFGGGLEQILEKEQRRINFRMQSKEINNQKDCEGRSQQSQMPISSEYNALLPPFKEKIRLLDVGSCYNPFKEFDQFITLGIDISPATDSVICCDFLSLDIFDDTLHESTDKVNKYIKELEGPLYEIQSSCFHVVVFSLLLEYLPSPKQRWKCCEKANQLLGLNGILIVITPDSHAQHKNAPMMKSWKKAIEHIGFERWRYSKQEHLHCMAFRKIKRHTSEPSKEEIDYDMLYIPQDFNVVEEESCKQPRIFSQEDEIEILETFEVLPLICDY